MQATLDIAEPTLRPKERDCGGRTPNTWQLRDPLAPASDPIAEPIVVIGSGPVGMRAVHELSRRTSQRHIVWYGAEGGDPYNRVQLSALLAGEASAREITGEYLAADYASI